MGNLLPRWKFAMSLARNELEGTSINLNELVAQATPSTPETVLGQLSNQLLGIQLDSETQDSLLEAVKDEGQKLGQETPAILAAGLMASPAFQWR